jgi:hypothetical protein
MRFVRLALFASCLLTICPLCGCGEKSVGPKTELNEQDKQQVEEYKRQATDEWGNKAR